MYFSFYNIHALTKTRALQSNSRSYFSLFLSFSPFSFSFPSLRGERRVLASLSLSQSILFFNPNTKSLSSLFHFRNENALLSIYFYNLYKYTRLVLKLSPIRPPPDPTSQLRLLFRYVRALVFLLFPKPDRFRRLVPPLDHLFAAIKRRL